MLKLVLFTTSTFSSLSLTHTNTRKDLVSTIFVTQLGCFWLSWLKLDGDLLVAYEIGACVVFRAKQWIVWSGVSCIVYGKSLGGNSIQHAFVNDTKAAFSNLATHFVMDTNNAGRWGKRRWAWTSHIKLRILQEEKEKGKRGGEYKGGAIKEEQEWVRCCCWMMGIKNEE